jgi:hypothetical protein
VAQRTKLSLNQGKRNTVESGTGIRMGRCRSPLLFNTHGEYLMEEVLAEIGDFKKAEG